MKILVTGGSGFVGAHVVREAAARRHEVVSLSRGVQRLPHNSTIQTVKVDLIRPHGLEDALRGVEVVVHAAGIHRERGSQSYERMHVGATANLIDACRRAGIRKLIHLSALGASVTAATSYLRTKREAEQMIEASGLRYTVFRPSLIFGAGDRLVTHLVGLLRFSPLVPVVIPDEVVVQPIWVGDVAAAIVAAARDGAADNRIFELGGPLQMTFASLVETVKKGMGRSAYSVRIPHPLAVPFARLGERLFDEPPLSAQQYEILSCGKTCDPGPAAVAFGLRMRSLIDVLPEYRT